MLLFRRREHMFYWRKLYSYLSEMATINVVQWPLKINNEPFQNRKNQHDESFHSSVANWEDVKCNNICFSYKMSHAVAN